MEPMKKEAAVGSAITKALLTSAIAGGVGATGGGFLGQRIGKKQGAVAVADAMGDQFNQFNSQENKIIANKAFQLGFMAANEGSKVAALSGTAVKKALGQLADSFTNLGSAAKSGASTTSQKAKGLAAKAIMSDKNMTAEGKKDLAKIISNASNSSYKPTLKSLSNSKAALGTIAGSTALVALANKDNY